MLHLTGALFVPRHYYFSRLETNSMQTAQGGLWEETRTLMRRGKLHREDKQDERRGWNKQSYANRNQSWRVGWVVTAVGLVGLLLHSRWMFGTHLQGPHQSVCWLRPKRARHFLGEPGSEHNEQHAQKNKKNKHKTREETKEEGGEKTVKG